jgi:hypothetical protein
MSSNSKKNEKTAMDRRKFLQVAGGAALASPLALGAAGALTPAAGTDQTAAERPSTGLDPATDLMESSLDFLDRAINEAWSIYGQRDVLTQRWEEGRGYFAQMQEQAAALGLAMNIVVDDTLAPEDGTFAIDFVTPLPTVDEFLANEDVNLAELQKAGPADNVRKVIAKILGLLGIKEASQAIFEILGEEGLIAVLDAAIKSGSLKAIGAAILKILEKMITKAFLKKLAEKIGIKAAAKIVGKISARFVPFLGWALLIGQLLWGIGEQIFG